MHGRTSCHEFEWALLFMIRKSPCHVISPLKFKVLLGFTFIRRGSNLIATKATRKFSILYIIKNIQTLRRQIEGNLKINMVVIWYASLNPKSNALHVGYGSSSVICKSIFHFSLLITLHFSLVHLDVK